MSAWLQVRRQTGRESWQLLSAKSHAQAKDSGRHALPKAPNMYIAVRKFWNFGIKLYHSLGECGHPGKPPFFSLIPPQKYVGFLLVLAAKQRFGRLAGFQPASLDFMWAKWTCCPCPCRLCSNLPQTSKIDTASLYSLCPADQMVELWSFWSVQAIDLRYVKIWITFWASLAAAKLRYSQV